MTIQLQEIWRAIPKFSYQVGDRGHVRHRPNTNRPQPRYVVPRSDSDGFLYVTLTRGLVTQEFRVDELICELFHGKPLHPDLYVEHIDGSPWNNWQSNLRWSFPDMAVRWLSGPITDACRGYFRRETFDRSKAVELSEPGDVIVGRDEDDKIVSFDFVFTRDKSKDTRNPYQVARQWRATVTGLMLYERTAEFDMPVSTDVREAIETYRRMADMHPDFQWALYLHEAAAYLEIMANAVYHGIEPPEDKIVSGRRVPIPHTRVAPPQAASMRRPFPSATTAPMPRPAMPVTSLPVLPCRRRPRRTPCGH